MSSNPRNESAGGVLDELLDERDLAQGLDGLARELPLVPPSTELWSRISIATSRQGRFRRFAAHVGSLLDLSEALALAWLDRAADASAFGPGLLPGMELLHVRGGARVAHAITGFVRLASGTRFPEHEHLGQESVLIMQGRLQDGERIAGPGEVLIMPAGSTHAFSVLPGPDLLYLAVVQNGVRIGEVTLTPDDPRA